MRFSLAFLAAAAVARPAAAQQSLLEVVNSTSGLATVLQAIGAAGLVEPLSGAGPLTLFAPVNLAFISLGAANPVLGAKVFDPKWQSHIADLLNYHIYEGSLFSTDLMAQSYTMMNGDNITVELTTAPFSITDANGNIANADTSLYDINATNGVAHVIDSVLIPGWMTKSVVDIAAAAPDQFSTLESLIERVGLVETLSGYGNDTTGFTVFAPVNGAFATVDATTLTDEQVTAILLYHVVAEPYTSMSLVSGPVTTLGGATIMIEVSDTGVKVNNAMVLFPDILANNGVVHVIGEVLMPPEGDTMTTPTAPTTPSAPVATPPDASPVAAPTSSAMSTTVSLVFAALVVVMGTVAWM